jgi:HlyD family secretion protein
MNHIKKYTACAVLVLLVGVTYLLNRSSSAAEEIPLSKVEKRHFDVSVKTIGELEAAKSTVVSSSIKGDLGKIVFLIQDGINVTPGEILVKMDPTPFEEKIEKLGAQIKEQEAFILTLKQTLDWEKAQAEHELKAAAFEIESSELELEKIIQGDGPLEMARLKSTMQKSWVKYEELSGFSDDLLELQKDGFLNPNELKQAEKKLSEEREAYESALMQYESYVKHVYPMSVKKGETSIKRSKTKLEEIAKTGGYKIGRSQALLDQARQSLNDLYLQLRDAKTELALTEIKAPAHGMVVHREEYRSGQKRKPRIGDILVKNQALMDLPDLNSMIVKTKVREIDLFKVAVSQKTAIQVDAYPQSIFSGTIDSLGVLALTDFARANEEKFFELRVSMDGADERLRPGMTARVTIDARNIKDALTVPVHAIFEGKNQSYCYACGVNGYVKKNIGVGACNDQWAEVTSGLEEGEWICLVNPFSEEVE